MVNNDCTVIVTELRDGSVDVMWKRNHPITDEESEEALRMYADDSAPTRKKRCVDKTKYKNIKCSHCKHFSKDRYTHMCTCTRDDEPVFISEWGRCKDFVWHERYGDES